MVAEVNDHDTEIYDGESSQLHEASFHEAES